MSKKEEIIRLWRENFKDTEEFIRFYFEKKYEDRNALIFEEGGKALAALQMLPYPMTWSGTEIKTSYISGACTSKEARNRGLMKKLLADAFGIMRKRNISLSTLIPAEPWLFGYYENFGYATVFDYATEQYTLTASDMPAGIHIEIAGAPEDTEPALYSWISDRQKQHPCSIQHTAKDFDIILQDLYTDGGAVATAKDSGRRLCAAAFVYPSKDHAWINEMHYNTEKDKHHLLQKIAETYSINKITCKIPADGQKAISQGMARIINARTMLSRYARCHPEISLSILLTDPQITANSGLYTLDKGCCSFEETAAGNTGLNMDIPALTQALLGYKTASATAGFPVFQNRQPFMNLMLD